MTVIYIPAQDVNKHWDYVLKGLEHLYKRAPYNYTSYDLYHNLKTGNFHLHMVMDEGEVRGFLVLQNTPGWNGNELHVFVAYSPHKGVVEEALEEVKQIGRKIGCVKLTFVATRKGWERRAEQLGYRQAHVAYEMDL